METNPLREFFEIYSAERENPFSALEYLTELESQIKELEELPAVSRCFAAMDKGEIPNPDDQEIKNRVWRLADRVRRAKENLDNDKNFIFWGAYYLGIEIGKLRESPL